MRLEFYCIIVKLCNIDILDKITHLFMKFTITPEFEGDKRHFHSNRLRLLLLQKTLTASSDIFLNFLGLCTGSSCL